MSSRMLLGDSRGQYTWYVSLTLFLASNACVYCISHLPQIVGGLHLAGPELADRIKPTVDFLSVDLVPAPTYVLPMHCSGFAVNVALEAELGDDCVPDGADHRVTIIGSHNAVATIHP